MIASSSQEDKRYNGLDALNRMSRQHAYEWWKNLINHQVNKEHLLTYLKNMYSSFLLKIEYAQKQYVESCVFSKERHISFIQNSLS